MLERKVLTLKEALVGLNAMLEEAEKQPGRPMSFGVADDRGDIICYYRMDGMGDGGREMVFRKCYTAAQLGDDTKVTRDNIHSEGMTMGGDMRHSQTTSAPGGVVIVPPGTERGKIGDPGEDGVCMARGQVGACGACGRISTEDEEIARVGAKAIQKLIWGKGK